MNSKWGLRSNCHAHLIQGTQSSLLTSDMQQYRKFNPSQGRVPGWCLICLSHAFLPTPRELLSAGFVVRAGARNVEEAERVLELAVTYGAIPSDQAERIIIVPFDIEDESTFVEALGDANKVRMLFCSMRK